MTKKWNRLVNQYINIKGYSLAKRLKLYLDKLIDKDRTGFMKNWFIGENIRKILDIIDYAEIEKIHAIIVSVDFEKRFDRIELASIYKTMEKFNFGEKYINWVKLLYNDTFAWPPADFLVRTHPCNILFLSQTPRHILIFF